MAREDLNPEVVEKITKNNRGWGRKHMLQHFPDLKESQQDRKREDMKVTIKELPKGNRELPAEEKSELSEEAHDSDGLSEAPSISTIAPVTERATQLRWSTGTCSTTFFWLVKTKNCCSDEPSRRTYSRRANGMDFSTGSKRRSERRI